MKKILNSFFLLAMFGTMTSQNFSPNENYIYSRSYLEPVLYNPQNSNANTGAKKIESIQYVDGLGRPKQDIAIGATYNGMDLVSTYFYDPITGIQTKQYLPIAKASTNGGFQDVSEEDINNYHGVTNAFSEIKTEQSPLMRPLETASPGDPWKMGNGKTKKVEYLFNNSTDVKRYIISLDTSLNNSPAVEQPSYYTPNTLQKLKSTDEDNNISYIFKNGLGQTILTQQENGTEKLDTYYLYDQYGRLAMIIPPKASTSPLTSDSISQLCYTYLYDDKGRLVEKKLPGKGVEYMVYDKADRLILYQDVNMREGGKWLITKYDKLGKALYTGFISGGNRQAMQSQCVNLLIFEEPNNTGFVRNGLTIYYSNYFFTDITEVLSVNYYDTYPQDNLAERPVSILGQTTLSDNLTGATSTKMLPTAYYVKNISDDKWTKNYYYYDDRGRNIGAKEINHLEGKTTTYKSLNFAGVVQRVETIHQRAKNGSSISVKERFEYNERNYLQKHFHQVDSRTEELLAEYSYDELGKVTNKKVGNNIQSIDYTYNTRGWLTTVNNLNDVSAGNKLFAYKLNYTEREGLEIPNVDYPNHKVAPRYNGNISEVSWKSVGKSNIVAYNTPQRQGFVYDEANRLLAGFYQYPDNPSIKGNSEIIENYDPNGNILKLKRTGNRVKGKVALIDNLTYNYSGNRMQSVTDATQNLNGYEGGGATIAYDDNGNMTNMPDKAIDRITYNYLNLPEDIQQTNPTTYYYRADGVKIKKKFILNNALGATTINTEYLNGFVYTTSQITQARLALEEQDDTTLAAAHANNTDLFVRDEFLAAPVDPNPTGTMVLAYFPTAEGYYDYRNNQYIYQYKDHLGNIRLSYARDANGSIVVLDQNDYYPFGMNMYGTSSIYEATGTPFNNKYNGKEIQETGLYDYGWRQYMSDLGRWNGMDKLSETYSSFSPYAYVMNNPVMMYDPDGRVSLDWINSFYTNSPDGKDTTWTNHNNDFYSDQLNRNGEGLSISADGTVSFGFAPVIIQAVGSASSWNSFSNFAYNSAMLFSGVEKAYSNWNYQQNRYKLIEAVTETKVGQSVANVENFLFRDIPMNLVGGELLSIGWRAAGIGKYLGQTWNYLTNNGGTFYRAMSSAEYAALQSNNGLTYMAGKELFVSSSSKYSKAFLQKSEYDVLVQFNMKRGAMNYFNQVGVMHRTAAGSSGWAARGNLLWKSEQGAMNLGIQQNTQMFNPWIKSFKTIP